MSYVENIVKDVARFAASIFSEIRERSDWVENNMYRLGQTASCILVFGLLVEAQRVYNDIVYLLTSLLMSGAVRAAARIYMVEADRDLISTLEEKGLVDPGRARDAIAVLESEASKVFERWSRYTVEFENALKDVKTEYGSTVEHVLEKYVRLGCDRVFTV